MTTSGKNILYLKRKKNCVLAFRLDNGNDSLKTIFIFEMYVKVIREFAKQSSGLSSIILNFFFFF